MCALAALLTGLAIVAAAGFAPGHVTRFAAAGPAGHEWGSRDIRLPVDLAPVASAGIGRFDRAFWPAHPGAFLRTRGGGITATFSSEGASLRAPGGVLDMSAPSLGRGGDLVISRAWAPRASANEVRYGSASGTELFRNGPYGLEQDFTVFKRPQAGSGPLVIALPTSGSLAPVQAGGEVRFRSASGATVLRYGQLSVVDALGRRLPAVIRVRGAVVELRIRDDGARYPVRVDPFIAQARLPGEGKGTFGGGEGGSVALSADGSTALVGSWEGHEGGYALVFARAGTSWSEQAKLIPARGAMPRGFGESVALSADGNTALVGSGLGNVEYGAAWVFTRSGTTWTQQTYEPLKGNEVGGGEEGRGHFGSSVALSADGNTALIGGPSDLPESQEGAVWVFARSGTTWAQQGPKLKGAGEISSPGSAYSEAGFGHSVALSANGDTALVGAWRDHQSAGAAWIFERSGSSWIQQGGKLTGGEEVRSGQFGSAVALSADASTALIGGTTAAWVFARSGGGWLQQGPKLAASGQTGEGEGAFGAGVALSADGNTALIGGWANGPEQTGAAWLFARSGCSWSQQETLTGPTSVAKARFGYSVALSPDATTALIGAPGEELERGAAWVFIGPPRSAPSTGSACTSAGSPTGGAGTMTPSSPVLSGARQSHRRWREGGRLASIARRAPSPLGTILSFALNEPARISLTFTQRVVGRLKGRCVAQTPRNRRRSACVRTVTRGELFFAGRAGRDKISFYGRLSRTRRLQPGRYTAVITAVSAAGPRSAPAQLSFTIVR